MNLRPDNTSPAAKAISIERKPWIEPEVEQLDLSETAAKDGTGHDGATMFADCTQS